MEIKIPPHCVENRGGHFFLKRETFAPPVGWRQPVALCGLPDELLFNMKGKEIGQEAMCRGYPGKMINEYGVEVESSEMIQVWRIVSLDSNNPLYSEVEFVSWAEPKPGFLNTIRETNGTNSKRNSQASNWRKSS